MTCKYNRNINDLCENKDSNYFSQNCQGSEHCEDYTSDNNFKPQSINMKVTKKEISNVLRTRIRVRYEQMYELVDMSIDEGTIEENICNLLNMDIYELMKEDVLTERLLEIVDSIK